MGRTVMFAFVRSESYESMVTLLNMFHELMGTVACSRLCTLMMDKMQAQMKAVKHVFHCEILLCYFHMCQAVRSHVRNVILLIVDVDKWGSE